MKPNSSLPVNPDLETIKNPYRKADSIREQGKIKSAIKPGTLGYFSILVWSLAIAALAPIGKLPWVVLVSLLIAFVLYPNAIRRIFNPRWLLLLAIIALPPLFFIGTLDRILFGIHYSSLGAIEAARMVMRFLIILLAVSGFAEKVDISAIAGLLERFGLQGLGFSMGVALNILPALQKSSTNAWQSLWLRGGFRKHKLTSLKYLIATIITNALQQAENIALAAETRAFNPRKSHPAPIQRNRLDIFILILGILSLALFVL